MWDGYISYGVILLTDLKAVKPFWMEQVCVDDLVEEGVLTYAASLGCLLGSFLCGFYRYVMVEYCKVWLINAQGS